jgi:hypothetical protein
VLVHEGPLCAPELVIPRFRPTSELLRGSPRMTSAAIFGRAVPEALSPCGRMAIMLLDFGSSGTSIGTYSQRHLQRLLLSQFGTTPSSAAAASFFSFKETVILSG